MLDAATFSKHLVETRLLLGSWAEAVTEGKEVPPALLGQVHELINLLTGLLVEAPEWQHAELNYLINRCRSIAARMAN